MTKKEHIKRLATLKEDVAYLESQLGNHYRYTFRNIKKGIHSYEAMITSEIQTRNILLDVITAQEAYLTLRKFGCCAKVDVCDIARPIRDTYKLSDIEALKIVRNELPLRQTLALLGLNLEGGE